MDLDGQRSQKFTSGATYSYRAFDGTYWYVVRDGRKVFPSLDLNRLFEEVIYQSARRHVPYFVFAHGALDLWFRQQYPLKYLKKCIYWPLQYEVLRRATAFLFIGESECEQGTASFWPNRWRSRIVPLGIKNSGK